MSEKIRLKGQLKLPVVGKNPTFAQMKFVKVALSEPDILPDSGSIFTCDEQGNYDFEIYTGAHLLSYNVGNAWSKPIEIIAEPLAEGLESIEISDLIGFQEIPELDATIAALNQQKQELLAIQQDVVLKQEDAAASAGRAEAAKDAAELAAASDHAIAFQHYVTLPTKLVAHPLGLSDSDIAAYTYDNAEKYAPLNSAGDSCYIDMPEFNFVFNQVSIPDGWEASLVFFANAGTSMTTNAIAKTNLLRYLHNTASHSVVKNSTGGSLIEIEGIQWGDNYVIRSESAVTYDPLVFGRGAVGLRVINLGTEILEIFGVGMVVRIKK